MNMQPDIISALWIALIVLLTLFAWRTIAGMMADSENAKSLGSAMLAITG